MPPPPAPTVEEKQQQHAPQQPFGGYGNYTPRLEFEHLLQRFGGVEQTLQQVNTNINMLSQNLQGFTASWAPSGYHTESPNVPFYQPPYGQPQQPSLASGSSSGAPPVYHWPHEQQPHEGGNDEE